MNDNKVKLIIVFLSILVVGLIGYIAYDKIIQKPEEVTNQENNNNQKDINLKDIKYDINEKLVGKFVYKDNPNEYFILNLDGTAEISFLTGGNGTVLKRENVRYQVTYNEKLAIIRFNTENSVYSPIRIGYLTENGYVFATTEETPVAGTLMFGYERE